MFGICKKYGKYVPAILIRRMHPFHQHARGSKIRLRGVHSRRVLLYMTLNQLRIAGRHRYEAMSSTAMASNKYENCFRKDVWKINHVGKSVLGTVKILEICSRINRKAHFYVIQSLSILYIR